MRWVDSLGYLASVLVFLTFYMRGMVALRVIALCSNFAFLSYAGVLHLVPILLLHGALIPVNIRRLACALQDQRVQLNSSAPGA